MPFNTPIPSYSRASLSKITQSALITLIALLPLCSTALNCPTALKKHANNTWHAPGFYPHLTYHSKLKRLMINGHDFGAALYDLKTKRLTCTYKTNNRTVKWASFKTNPNGRIKPDLNAINRHTHRPLWQYSAKNNDYACTQSQQKCVFNLEEVMSKP